MAFFARPPTTQVRISHPGSEDIPSPRKDSTQRQCRNIVIYGRCKFQDKGCQYHHPSPTQESPPTTTTTSATLAVNAPVFVPKAAAPASPPIISPPISPQPIYEQQLYNQYVYAQSEGTAVDESIETRFYDDSQYPFVPPYDQSGLDSWYTHPPPFLRQPLNYLLYTPQIPSNFVTSDTPTHFVPPSQELRQKLQIQSETIHTIAPLGSGLPDECQGYHSFVPLEPVGATAGSERRKLGNWYSTVYRAIRASNGKPYTLRRVENHRLMHQSAFSAIETWSNIRHPNIVPVEEAFTTKAFNDNSLVVCYAYYPNATTLYDLHFKKSNTTTSNLPTLSTPKRSSTTSASATVTSTQQLDPSSVIPERTLWSYITQIACAIKKVHDMGQPVRMIDPTKILVTSSNLVRIGSCGILDVLLYPQTQLSNDPTGTMNTMNTMNAMNAAVTQMNNIALMQDDLTMFGRLLFCLTCGGNSNAWTAPQFQKSLDWMGRQYKPEVKSVCLWLMSKAGSVRHHGHGHHGHHGGGHHNGHGHGAGGGGSGNGNSNGQGSGSGVKNIDQLLDMIRPKIVSEMEESMLATDRLEAELLSELENARLVRLLCKFGFINERPEFALEPRWSETGDRYIIKLFRDYVFHQVDEHGNPVVNMSHVLTCLNKLDAGSEERIMLVSRDDTSCLVVSYKEIKACMEGAFSDLARPAGSSQVSFQPAR